MLELDDGEHEQLVEREVPELDSKKRNDCEPQDRRGHHLAEMEPVGRRHIHVRIRVVDPVEVPKHRYAVADAVPPVGPEIHEQNGPERMEPGRKRNQPKQTEAVRRGPFRHDQPKAGEEQGGDDGVEDAQKDVLRSVGEPFAFGAELKKEGNSAFP